jgi:hypothetical protein
MRKASEFNGGLKRRKNSTGGGNDECGMKKIDRLIHLLIEEVMNESMNR